MLSDRLVQASLRHTSRKRLQYNAHRDSGKVPQGQLKSGLFPGVFLRIDQGLDSEKLA